jgi:hypothetical protein
LFYVGPLWADFHLTFSSPCKDAGDNNAVSIPTFDYEGDPRIANGAVDMGWDEIYTHTYVEDVQTGGIFFRPGFDIEV